MVKWGGACKGKAWREWTGGFARFITYIYDNNFTILF
jgi:hypothetical protein